MGTSPSVVATGQLFLRNNLDLFDRLHRFLYCGLGHRRAGRAVREQSGAIEYNRGECSSPPRQVEPVVNR